MGKFQFGTDGIRGEYGTFPITYDAVYKLVYALIEWLKQHQDKEEIILMVARDTRHSSEILLQAIVSAAGCHNVKVISLGVTSTPSLSWLMRQQITPATVGLMITASHNPWQDNGIKIFSHLGCKFSVQQERELEDFINQCEVSTPLQKANNYGEDAGSLLSDYQHYLQKRYSDYLTVKPPAWHVIVDTANGALYQLAYQVLLPLGYKITAMANQPNGKNINHCCGATHPEIVAQEVIAQKANIGVCFDGDGDRILLCDSQGRVIDGDGILYLLAPIFGSVDSGVVGTQMTNGFVEKTLRQLNIPFTRTPVGDKYIAEALEKNQWLLGGESSGHILLPKYNPCGDALLVFLFVLAILHNKKSTLDEAFAEFFPHPQKLVNLQVEDKSIVQNPKIQQEISILQEQYPEAIILVRPSGTENLVRVMVESADEAINDELSKKLVSLFR